MNENLNHHQQSFWPTERVTFQLNKRNKPQVTGGGTGIVWERSPWSKGGSSLRAGSLLLFLCNHSLLRERESAWNRGESTERSNNRNFKSFLGYGRWKWVGMAEDQWRRMEEEGKKKLTWTEQIEGSIWLWSQTGVETGTRTRYGKVIGVPRKESTRFLGPRSAPWPFMGTPITHSLSPLPLAYSW